MTDIYESDQDEISTVANSRPIGSCKRYRRSDAYIDFRFRSDVDWIKLRIVTERPTNFMSVRKHMGVKFVEALDEGPGRAATVFECTIQDPTSWKAINAVLRRFTADHPLAEPVTVTAIEISLDAYSRRGIHGDIVGMTAHFFKFATKMVSSKPRWTQGDHSTTDYVNGFQRLIRRLGEGFNVYVGHKGDSIKQHFYVKRTTIEDGFVKNLPTNEHRARTEFTLSGEALPYRLLSEWEQHDFTSHAEFFQYRKLKQNLHPMTKQAVDVLDQIGEKRARRRKCRGTRFFSPSTVADTELNNLTYSALRELTKRMKG